MILVIIIIAVFLTFAYLAFFQKKAIAPTNYLPQTQESSPSASPASFSSEDEILKNALNLYIQKKQAGLDFTNGPCLGKIADDWVLDIAHNPRQPIDDRSQNQCPEFLDGSSHHFIELDPSGNLIRSL